MKKVHVFCLISFLLLTVIFCIGCSGTMEPSPEKKNSDSSKKDENPAIEFDNDYWYTVYFDDSFNSYSSGDKDPNPQYLYVRKPATTVQQLPEPPVHKGYEFAGWYTEPNGNGTEFTADTEVTGNITVYAKWIRYYEVKFSEYPEFSQRVREGELATKPEDPVIPSDSYVFDGWYICDEYTDYDDVPFDFTIPITRDIVIDFKLRGCYKVVFSLRYQDINDFEYKDIELSQKVVIGGLAIEPEETIVEGYTCEGWYTDSIYTDRFDFTTPINERMFLFAKLIPNNSIQISVTVEPSSDISISKEQNGSIIRLIADLGFDSYRWKINGEIQTEESNVLSFDKSALTKGTYIISVKARNSDNYKSAVIYIRVEE